MNVEKIERIFSQGNYIEIHLAGDKFLLRETMDGIERKLNPKEFLRIRRSTIVRVSQIKELHQLFGGEYSIILSDETEFTSSRRYRKNLDAVIKN